MSEIERECFAQITHSASPSGHGSRVIVKKVDKSDVFFLGNRAPVVQFKYCCVSPLNFQKLSECGNTQFSVLQSLIYILRLCAS